MSLDDADDGEHGKRHGAAAPIHSLVWQFGRHRHTIDRQPIAALGEIWAFGLRNPWRYSFDDWTRGGTGALVVADVGQNAREEVNWEPRGAGGRNYGWRLREGRAAYDARQPAAYLPLTEPIHDYPRSAGMSITGGFVYRGAALPQMFNGRYFFADYVAGRVFTIGVSLNETQEATAVGELELTTNLGGATELGLIGVAMARARRSRQMSKPFFFGSMTSRITRSGVNDAAFCRPSSPSAAVSTS